MAKVIQFPLTPVPEKFGPKKVLIKKKSAPAKNGQLNLFSGGKVVRLNQLSAFEEALMLDDHGDARTAKSVYLKAIQEGDSLADAYCNLGILEFEEEHYTKAIDYFTLSLKHDPRHFEAHYNLANLYAEVENFKLAKVHYQVSIEIEPTFPNSYFNLGLALALNKEFILAIKILEQYIHLSPESDHKYAHDLIAKLRGN